MKVYTIDPAHSEIGFAVKHMMISTVRGNFRDFTATMKSDSSDFLDAEIEFECSVNSIWTNISDRDSHLKSEEFFSAEKFPKIKFKSTTVTKESDVYFILGEMTIKDITRPLKLNGIYNGMDIDLYGNKKHGFELNGLINRGDYGLKFNIMSGKGNSLISEEIKLQIHVQMIEQ